jgi:hypothetical protein
MKATDGSVVSLPRNWNKEKSKEDDEEEEKDGDSFFHISQLSLILIKIINNQGIYLQKYIVYILITFLVIIFIIIMVLVNNKPSDIAEIFSKKFQLVYGSSCPGIFPLINQSTEVLSSAPI